jgi:acyl-homoserine lactone acylase PvdQ
MTSNGAAWRHRVPLKAAVATAVLIATLAVPGQAEAQAPVRTASFSGEDYCLGQCGDILPPGENGSASLAEILGNQAFGTQPGHADDQLGKYASLAAGYSSLTDAAINGYYSDASLDVAPTEVESVKTPRSDVTITRDKATGVAHVRGTTRSGTEYGAGWIAGADRLWLMDVLRHVGRGQLSSFAGGAPSNRLFEQTFFAVAPYTEADLQAQVDRVAASGTRGAQALADVKDYLLGVNAYITQAKANRTFPGEYVLTGKIDSVTNAGTIEPFTATDIVAIGAVVGALFGTGGGGEVQSALALLAAEKKYGATEGRQVWRAFQEQDDPEAVETIHDGKTFSYGNSPASPTGVALPDAGSVAAEPLLIASTGSAATATAGATVAATTTAASTSVVPTALTAHKSGMSNALVISAANTVDGHPIAVFGPQTGYFAPQLLMLEELDGPGIHARGVAFAGTNFYVQMGRGIDYSWSATSAGQDITDSYALTLCNTDGSAATTASTSYLFHGTCTAMESMTRTNSWAPTTADGTAAGSTTMRVYRTKYGLVTHRGTVGGAPVAFTSLRSTYKHEVESIIGFQEFNDPAFVNSPQTFQQAAYDVGYTFNWFYVDSTHSAYINSGANPTRPAHVEPTLPIVASAANEWVGWDSSTNATTYTPYAQHPQSIDQDYYTNWNNKQAPGVAAGNFGEGSVHRGDLLDSLVKADIAKGTKYTRALLVRRMMQAGLTDLRGSKVLPVLLAVLNTSTITDSATATAAAQLKTWLDGGALRTETSAGSKVYANADAIRILDAWWPLLVKAEFSGALGTDLYSALSTVLQTDESPSGSVGNSSSVESAQGHKGSSFQFGWWSYVDKDLRSVLGRPVAGGLTKTFCGNGVLATCRDALLSTLKTAAATAATTVYPGDATCAAGDQWCADSIVQSVLGGIKHSNVTWANRPTFQQVVQFPANRSENIANLAANKTVTASASENGRAAKYAVDLDGTTRWGSDWSDAQWIYVDLGSAKQVGRAVLRWESAYGKAYTIQVSSNATTWTTVASVTDGTGGTDNLDFTPTSARYVRLAGTARGTQYGYSLYEFEVYAK